MSDARLHNEIARHEREDASRAFRDAESDVVSIAEEIRDATEYDEQQTAVGRLGDAVDRMRESILGLSEVGL